VKQILQASNGIVWHYIAFPLSAVVRVSSWTLRASSAIAVMRAFVIVSAVENHRLRYLDYFRIHRLRRITIYFKSSPPQYSAYIWVSRYQRLPGIRPQQWPSGRATNFLGLPFCMGKE
jgi:hypothetical protein